MENKKFKGAKKFEKLENFKKVKSRGERKTEFQGAWNNLALEYRIKAKSTRSEGVAKKFVTQLVRCLRRWESVKFL